MTLQPQATTPPSGPMDNVDRQLLDIIQTGFPLTPRPYADLGQRLGISEQEALERVRALKQSKIIRRLGANFQSAKLGFVSTLCAAKVPQEKMDDFVARVNACPGVTHHYLREHDVVHLVRQNLPRKPIMRCAEAARAPAAHVRLAHLCEAQPRNGPYKTARLL